MMCRLARLAAVAAATALSGCTLQQYAEQADRTVYRTISSARRSALGSPGKFSIEYRRLVAGKSDRLDLGGRTISLHSHEQGKLSLDECLLIAFRNSRDYQTRKEELYAQALAVANGRRGWDLPVLGGETTGVGGFDKDAHESTDFPTEAQAGLTLTRRLIHGGMLTVGAALDMATDFLGSQGLTVGSLLDATFTQPLLRGAWHGFAYEDQYRLERDLLFAVYEFSRFRQTFAADILDEFYAVLELRDRLANERTNIERLRETRDLTRVLAEGGQVSRIQLDQAEQNLLNAQVRLAGSHQSYLNSLDSFKIMLGLPVTANVAPAYPEALAALRALKPNEKDIPFTEAEATVVALASRPDVLTEGAAVRDARRNVEVAADAFRPQLDLAAGASVAGTEPQKFHRLEFKRPRRFANLTFSYSIDQTDNRDAYREALIALARARRNHDEFLDQVRQDIRRSYRSLAQRRQTHALQTTNVEIAARRRALASQQQKEGQASARDVLEAEEALRNAQNGLTNATVGYFTTRMAFLAELGMIRVDERGKIHERVRPVTFQRLRRSYPYATGAPDKKE